MASRKTFASALALTLALGGACADDPQPQTECENGTCDEAKDGRYGLCAAIRGNGQLIPAHFASMARITEHYGLIEGSAGGSSASITQFFAESIRMNPQVFDCGDEKCSEAEVRARAGLLFKSFPGYMAALKNTPEGQALSSLAPLVQRIREAGIDALLEEDPDAAADAIRTLLESDDLAALLNPELLILLQTSPDPAFHVADILDALEKMGDFTTDDPTIFVRPGLIEFETLGEKLGRAASFYAGYAPANPESMSAFLDSCALPGVGKSWFEVMQLPAGDGTCGELFDDAVSEYRSALLEDEQSFPNRIDDPVGRHLAALVATSIVTGPSVSKWEQARLSYLNGGAIDSVDVAWDDVRFGYWGRDEDLAEVAANAKGYTDPKTGKFLALTEAGEQTSWRTALKYSPAEPGLNRAQELSLTRVSFGGWSDLHPVLVLKNMGCDKVIYVTRAGEDSGFALGVAGHLGADVSKDPDTGEFSGSDHESIWDLDEEDSSFSKSIAEADAVWCTNWNDISASDVVAVTLDAYNAPMESSDPFFTANDTPYENQSENLGKRGCSVGAE